MRFANALLPLPAPLLLLIATFQSPTTAIDENQSPAQWPYNLPAHVKYWPEDPPHRRRDLEAIEQNILAGKSPIGVKKMGVDEGEKFFAEYWGFEDSFLSSDFQSELSNIDRALKLRLELSDTEKDSLYMNESIPLSFRYPFATHQSEETESRQAVNGWNVFGALLGRDSSPFTCPTGTLSCTNINRPNSCCASDETCFIITDTGLGDVGCCGNGETCTSQQISCPANDQSCPDSTGGGCCIPGFVCDGPGCVPTQSIVTVITTITVNPSSGTSIVVFTSTSIQSESFTASFTASATATVTSLQTTLACSPSYQACPINLGGGCCLSNRQCGATDCPTSSGSSSTLDFTTATPTVIVPVGPTSTSGTITVFKSTNSAVATGTSCPIGFYGCSAVHQGGCCRTGRNCDTTDCPAIQKTTIISAGETIVVPVGTAGSLAAVATSSGACALGWFNCASVLGGGCCPSGFSCGTASCSSFSGTKTVEVGPKGTVIVTVNESGVGKSRRIGMKGWLGGVVGICWVGSVVMILTMMWL